MNIGCRFDMASTTATTMAKTQANTGHTSNSIITPDDRVVFRFQRTGPSSPKSRHTATLSLKRNDVNSMVLSKSVPDECVVQKTPAEEPQQEPQQEPVTTTEQQQVEIFPGYSTRLRGAQETWKCIEEGFYLPVTCLSCTLQLCCILDADFVICPCCQGITPVQEGGGGGDGTGGAGLGCTLEDVHKRIQGGRDCAASLSTTNGTRRARFAPPRTCSVSLYDIFPPHVAEALHHGRAVEPEEKDCVTIFFSDIVGFTDISSTLEPRKIANMLDRLYSKLDYLSAKYDLYKIETIGDAFMAATNLVKDQSTDHVKRVAQFSLAAIQAANETLIDEDDLDRGYIHIRVGFHTGSVVADVVGQRNPRYCLFGDAVNVASRMESNSARDSINCSERSASILREQWPEVHLQDRGEIAIKGKGDMQCYFVQAP